MAMPSPEPDKLTYEDYCQIPEDRNRHEIVDGVHVVSPAPTLNHQDLAGEIYYRLRRFLDDHDLGRAWIAPVDVLLGPHDVLQPDVLFISKPNLAIAERANVKGAPDLVVEVLSSHRRHDVVHKRARYQVGGVQEYWLVDPEADAIQVLRRDAAGELVTAATLSRHEGPGLLVTPLLPGFTLDVGRLFAAP